MRLNLIIILLTFSCGFSHAQNTSRHGFFNKTKLGALIRTKTEPTGTTNFSKMGNGTEITTINGYFINSTWAVGLGISANSYVNPTLSMYPVFANIHYYFKDQAKTPFAFANMGYNIFFDDFYKGGILYEVGLGYHLKLGKKTILTPEIAYKYQDYNMKNASTKKSNLQSISLGVGILF